MKTTILAAITLLISGTAQAEFACNAGLYDDMVSKHTLMNSETGNTDELSGYAARRDVGGYTFTAVKTGDTVKFRIIADSSSKAVLSTEAPLSSAEVTVRLSRKVTAYITCSAE